MSPMEESLDAAIREVIAKHPENSEAPEMVTKWVTLIEVVDTNGNRGLWTATGDDVKAWDTLGLLQYGVELQRANIMEGNE